MTSPSGGCSRAVVHLHPPREAAGPARGCASPRPGWSAPAGAAPAAARRRPGRVRRSRLPVGSSASSSAGRWISARATATRCRSPPDSSAGRWSSRSDQADAARAARGAQLLGVGRSSSPTSVGTSTFSSTRALRQQVVVLEDEADVPVAEVGQLALGQGERVLAVEADGAGGRPVEGAEDVQQRALAGAGRPHDRHAAPASARG